MQIPVEVRNLLLIGLKYVKSSRQIGQNIKKVVYLRIAELGRIVQDFVIDENPAFYEVSRSFNWGVCDIYWVIFVIYVSYFGHYQDVFDLAEKQIRP